MNTLMDKARKIAKWYISLIVCIVFSICAAVYFKAIAGLEKPAGMSEAMEFLVDSPKEYALCLMCGGIAKISVLVMLIVAVSSLICLADTFLNGEAYYYCNSKKQNVICGIVNCILLVIMTVVQSKIIVDFWVLLGLIVVIGIIVKALIDSN